MSLLFEGLSFPLLAAGDAIPQPFVDRALPYLQDCINAYVGAAFADVIRGKVQGQAGTLACQQTGRVDPSFQLTKTTFRAPYLSLAIESGVFSEATLQWDQDVSKFALSYILPPLPEETIQEVAVPLLAAVAKLLALLVKNGGDPHHRSGARVWEEAGIVAVRLGAYQIEHIILGDDVRTVQVFPLLRAEVFVTGQEGFDGSPYATGFETRTSLDNASADGIAPDAVQFDVTPGSLAARRRTFPAPETNMQTLRFLAREGDHSFSPPATRANRVVPIGKTRQEDGTWSIDTEPATVTLHGDDEHADRSFLRGEVLEGRLVAATEETAAYLDVPFAKPTAPPAPAAQLEPATADAKHVDTIPPPALDAPAETPAPTTKAALSKRTEK